MIKKIIRNDFKGAVDVLAEKIKLLSDAIKDNLSTPFFVFVYGKFKVVFSSIFSFWDINWINMRWVQSL